MQLSSQLLQICPVCDSSNKLYHMSKCQHMFCKQCCISFIQARTGDFNRLKCLQQGCLQKIDKSLPVYQFINNKTQNQIIKQQRLVFLQQNPLIKNCAFQDCDGNVNTQQIQAKCSICHRKHCRDCMKMIHQGICDNSNDRDMKKNGFMKCPNCKLWVQKTQGCQYIYCKCLTAFCYRCGISFDKCPCRKKDTWDRDQNIRQLMSKIKIPIPSTPFQYLIFVPKMLAILIISILRIFVSTFIIFFFYLCNSLVLFLIGPAIIIQQISCHHDCICFIACIFYVPIGILLVVFAIPCYPCLRKTYHHGILDGMQEYIQNQTVSYLNCVIYLLT